MAQENEDETTNEDLTQTNPVEPEEEEEEQAPTPFDHPLFLPVLLSGLTLWFGYDGFINTDPDMLEHGTFNRVGFGVLLIAAIYYWATGYKEWKEDQKQ